MVQEPLVHISPTGDIKWRGNRVDLDALGCFLRDLPPDQRAIPTIVMRIERLRLAAEPLRGQSPDLDTALDQFG